MKHRNLVTTFLAWFAGVALVVIASPEVFAADQGVQWGRRVRKPLCLRFLLLLHRNPVEGLHGSEPGLPSEFVQPGEQHMQWRRLAHVQLRECAAVSMPPLLQAQRGRRSPRHRHVHQRALQRAR